MSFLRTLTIAALAAPAAMATGGIHAATLTTLYAFTGTPNDGEAPLGPMATVGGILYGTTQMGGSSNAGVIFSVDPATGIETVLHSFGQGSDGGYPQTGLIAHNGILYGTTETGSQNSGVAFSFNPATKVYSILHMFGNSASDGAFPYNLIYHDGFLYGTTSISEAAQGFGTIFRIDPTTGNETIVYRFTNSTDVQNPYVGLTYGNGKFYGIGSNYASGSDVVYSFDPATRIEAAVYAFPPFFPESGLTFHNGIVYGVIEKAGSEHAAIFQVDTSTGAETTLYTFPGGARPVYTGPFTFHGNVLYGATFAGRSPQHQGVIFKFDLVTKREINLYKFTGGADGAAANNSLREQSGAFYGTAIGGGVAGCGMSQAGCGTVFKLTP